MAIITAVATGLALGKLASGMVFKYTQSAYLERIEKLDEVIGKLNNHLTNLTSLRNEIPAFWNDEESQKATNVINNNIDKVTRQLKTAEDMAKILRDTVDSLETGKAGLKEKIEGAENLLNILEL